MICAADGYWKKTPPLVLMGIQIWNMNEYLLCLCYSFLQIPCSHCLLIYTLSSIGTSDFKGKGSPDVHFK